MAKKRDPMTTVTVRLSTRVLDSLQARSSEQRQSVSAVIRSLIADFLDGADAFDALGETEARIIAALDRVERQRVRQRRQSELIMLEVDYLRRNMDYRFMKRLAPDEDTASVFRRSDKTYFDWLQKVHKHRLDMLTNAITEPTVMLDKVRDATDEPPKVGPGPAAPAPNPTGGPGPLVDAPSKLTTNVGEARSATDAPRPVQPESAIPAPKPEEMATTDVAAPISR